MAYHNLVEEDDCLVKYGYLRRWVYNKAKDLFLVEDQTDKDSSWQVIDSYTPAIPVEKVEVLWSENPFRYPVMGVTNFPHVITREMAYKDWAETVEKAPEGWAKDYPYKPSHQLYLSINTLLGTAAYHAPDSGAYHKTGFRVTWMDGSSYQGRFDLTHEHRLNASVGAHIIDFCEFHSGRRKPIHMTEKQYTQFLSIHSAEQKQQLEDYLDKYEIIAFSGKNGL